MREKYIFCIFYIPFVVCIFLCIEYTLKQFRSNFQSNLECSGEKCHVPLGKIIQLMPACKKQHFRAELQRYVNQNNRRISKYGLFGGNSKMKPLPMKRKDYFKLKGFSKT